MSAVRIVGREPTMRNLFTHEQAWQLRLSPRLILGAGSHELKKTMRTVTAAYWIPLQVREPPEKRSKYTGFGGKDYEPVEEFMSEVIEDITHIYGNIAGMYYTVQRVDDAEGDSCFFHLQVVITGIVAGDADADDYIDNAWPTDLEEWFCQRWEQQTGDDLLGYDLNPMLQHPTETFHNGTWQ